MTNSTIVAYLKVNTSFYLVPSTIDQIKNTIKTIDEHGIPSNGFININIFKTDQLNNEIKNALGFQPIQQIYEYNELLRLKKHLDPKHIYISNHTPSS